MTIKPIGQWILTSMVIIACGVYAVESPSLTIVQEARIKASEGDLERAATLYYKALQLDSDNSLIRKELAAVLIKGQIDEPYAEQPDSLKLIETSQDFNFPAARFPLAFLDNAALNAEDRLMSRKVLLVLQKLQGNDNKAAIKIGQVLQRKYPTHPVPYNLLGLAWQGQGDPSKAEEFFQRALALNNDFHAARINLAELELHLGEYLTAHRELDTVLQKDPNNRRACLIKAQLYGLEGRDELSKEWYSKASEAL